LRRAISSTESLKKEEGQVTGSPLFCVPGFDFSVGKIADCWSNTQ
jgi:hypothetical protein